MKKDFGTILQQQYGLRAEDLQDARKVKREKGGSLGDILIQRELISETDLLNAYSLLYDIPFWPDLPMESLGSELVEKVPIHFLKKHTMVPLAVRGGLGDNRGEETDEEESLLEAFQPLDDLVRMLDLDDHTLVLSTRSAITAAINIFFDASRDSAEQLVQDMEEDGSDIISEIEDTADLLEDTSDAPIIKLVNHIISQSTKARASDIHIEPYQDSFKVRYRVDGILYDLLSPPKWIQPALTSRIKVMAKLNIAEKRLPQDGRFEVKVGSQVVDVRVSTLPTQFGERVVMRLLNKSGSILEMSELGLSGPRLNQMKQLVSSPNGIILVTGPTGSGKTTSLYATLNSINTPDINIITIEDPVEYQLQGISQIQVNPKIDLTFARGLRSIVRQDPDVILVGEIRDRETAEIAVQSALTGHLVFSTLHTNDSASAITRLVDIGVEPFLISSSVLAVIAQRLVRVLCEHCKAPEENVDAISVLGVDAATAAEHSIYRAVGCEQCFQTGYRGRIAIFEIMTMSATLKSLIQKTYDSFQIKEQAGSEGMVTLRSDGVDKVLSGITTIEEVIRVTQI
ncbi:MAG: type II secretion system ATPase GspE [Desulfosarcinaceae bacterium]